MSIFQHYYTSVTGKGFQTYRYSEELDDDLIKILERKGTYTPPKYLPSSPSDEELEKFPVSLSYYKNGDKYIITQSKYIGKEYTGRFGNYFAHSIIYDKISEIGLNPIQLWGASFWVSEEEKDFPKVTFNNPSITINSIKEFIKTRKSQLDILLLAIDELLKTNKRIIIVDSERNVAFMIYLLALVTPRDIFTNKISFTTYTNNPNESNFSISGTIKNSDFRFTSEDYSEYSIFNYQENKFPDGIPNHERDFSIIKHYLVTDGVNKNNDPFFKIYFSNFQRFDHKQKDCSDILLIHDLFYATMSKVTNVAQKNRLFNYIEKSTLFLDKQLKEKFLQCKNYELLIKIFEAEIDSKNNHECIEDFIELSPIISSEYIDQIWDLIIQNKKIGIDDYQRILTDSNLIIFISNTECFKKIAIDVIKKYSTNKSYQKLLKIINQNSDGFDSDLKAKIKDKIKENEPRRNTREITDFSLKSKNKKHHTAWWIYLLLIIIAIITIFLVITYTFPTFIQDNISPLLSAIPGFPKYSVVINDTSSLYNLSNTSNSTLPQTSIPPS